MEGHTSRTSGFYKKKYKSTLEMVIFLQTGHATPTIFGHYALSIFHRLRQIFGPILSEQCSKAKLVSYGQHRAQKVQLQDFEYQHSFSCQFFEKILISKAECSLSFSALFFSFQWLEAMNWKLMMEAKAPKKCCFLFATFFFPPKSYLPLLNKL